MSSSSCGALVVCSGVHEVTCLGLVTLVGTQTHHHPTLTFPPPYTYVKLVIFPKLHKSNYVVVSYVFVHWKLMNSCISSATLTWVVTIDYGEGRMEWIIKIVASSNSYYTVYGNQLFSNVVTYKVLCNESHVTGENTFISYLAKLVSYSECKNTLHYLDTSRK